MRKRIRHFLAFQLALITLLLCPVNAYASVLATASNMEDYPSMDDYSDGEYMPDNIMSRYEESFEYCPDMPPNPHARIALADDVVMVIVALLAACGIYVGSNSDLVHQIVSGFDTYIRRTAGNVKSVMTAWAAVLSAEAGKTIEGIKVLLPYLRDYLKSFFIGYGTGALEYSYSTGAGALTDGPYSLPGIAFQEKYNTYAFSFSSLYETNMDYDIFWGQPSVPALDNLYVAYLAGGSASKYIQVACINEDDVFEYNGRPHFGWRRYVPADNAYKYSNGVTRYSTGNINIWASGSPYILDDCIQMVANTISCPLFKDADYARSFLKYGSMDGLIQPDPDFTVTVPNAWTQLQQDTFDRFGNTLTLPSTPEEWEAIKSQLASAATADDALKALSGVMDITSGGGITSMTPYLHLSYVLDAVSAYAGAGALSADIRNGFMGDYLNVSIAGSTIEQLNMYAQTIVNRQVTITGTAEDNDKNSFVITAALAAALIEYLVSVGLLDVAIDIPAGTKVRENVSVAAKAVTPDNPDNPSDLTGILSVISAILAAIGGLPALIATEIIKALASSPFASGITLSLDNIRTGIAQIAQWDFADWTVALGAALIAPLKSIARDLGFDGIASRLDDIAQWDFADWSVALGATVLLALETAGKRLGIDSLAGALAGIAQWDFADWKVSLRSILDTVFISGLAGILALIEKLVELLKDFPNTLKAILQAVLSLPAEIAKEFLEMLKALFIPANNPFMKLKDEFKLKFPFIAQITALLSGIIFVSGDGIPKFEFTYMGVTVGIFNIEWLLDFLPFIHGLILALAYYKYFHRLQKRLPRIIGGIT